MAMWQRWNLPCRGGLRGRGWSVCVAVVVSTKYTSTMSSLPMWRSAASSSEPLDLVTAARAHSLSAAAACSTTLTWSSWMRRTSRSPIPSCLASGTQSDSRAGAISMYRCIATGTSADTRTVTALLTSYLYCPARETSLSSAVFTTTIRLQFEFESISIPPRFDSNSTALWPFYIMAPIKGYHGLLSMVTP